MGIPYVGLFIYFGLFKSFYVMFCLYTVCGLALIFSHFNYDKISKFTLIIGLSVLLLCYSILLGKDTGAPLIFFPVISMALVLFDPSEKAAICIGSLIPVIGRYTFEYLDKTHSSLLIHFLEPVLPIAQIIIYEFAILTAFLFSFYFVYFFFFASYRNLESKNKDLEAANKSLIEKAKIDKDIAAAAHVQLQTVPKAFPQLPGIRIDHFYQPARNLGGDFIDGILLPDDKVLIVIGDIVGKGIQASLKMSMFYPLFRNFINNFQDLPTLVNDCNTFAHAFYEFTKHIPCLFAVIDAKNHTLTFINAGHEPGYVLRGSEMIKIDTPGFALGMELEPSHEEGAIQLQKGDRVVFFTDGFTDIQNEDGSRFDAETLLEVMLEIDQGDHITFIDILVDRLMAYKQTADQADDMAIVSIKIV